MPTGLVSKARFFACFLAAACACGDSERDTVDGGSPPPPSPADQASKVCDAHLAWSQRCASQQPLPPGEPYWGESECLDDPWRYMQQRFIDAYTVCLGSLSCDSSDDTCADAGFRAIGIETAADVESDALASRCFQLAEQCSDMSDDACLYFVAFTEAGRNAIAPCLDLECSQIGFCLHNFANQR